MATGLAGRRLFDFSLRTKLRVTGADCVRFLNGQITNDIRKATDTNAIEACILNAKGKLEAHVFARTEGDSFCLDADPALQSTLPARLDRYIIADDVQIEDVTAQLSIFHVIGTPRSTFSFATHVSINRFGPQGHDIWCDAADQDRLSAAGGTTKFSKSNKEFRGGGAN